MSEVYIDKIRTIKIRTIEILKTTKANIEKKHEDSLKLWDKCIDEYAKLMKRNLNTPRPPTKPQKPRTLDRVDGYIDMLGIIEGEKIKLEFDDIRGIFNDLMESSYEVSSVFMALSDYSLTLDRGTVEGV